MLVKLHIVSLPKMVIPDGLTFYFNPPLTTFPQNKFNNYPEFSFSRNLIFSFHNFPELKSFSRISRSWKIEKKFQNSRRCGRVTQAWFTGAMLWIILGVVC